MADVSVTVEGATEVADEMECAELGVYAQVYDCVGQALQEGYQVMQSMTPVRTGYLQSSGGFDQSGLTGTLYNTAPYASYVVNGARGVAGRDFITPGQEAAVSFLNSCIQDVEVACQEFIQQKREEEEKRKAEEKKAEQQEAETDRESAMEDLQPNPEYEAATEAPEASSAPSASEEVQSEVTSGGEE